MDRIHPRRALTGTLRSGQRLAIASLVLAIGVVGCGSSSKPKLTKAQFLAQANAICTAGNAKTNALGSALGNNPSPAKAASAVTTEFVPEIQGEINSVRALAVQTADKNKLSSMLDLAQADLNKVKANPQLFVASASPFHNFAVQAHAYGLTACAQGA